MNRSNWRHDGIPCNGCRMKSIVGYRYFCTICAVSLCESCDQLGMNSLYNCSLVVDLNVALLGTHHRDHNMLKMIPAPNVHYDNQSPPDQRLHERVQLLPSRSEFAHRMPHTTSGRHGFDIRSMEAKEDNSKK